MTRELKIFCYRKERLDHIRTRFKLSRDAG